MEYRQLGHTDMKVSLLGLGTMTWGKQNTEQDAHVQLSHATDNGINLIDTAEMYPVPPEAETATRTESYIGTWLAQNPTKRDKIILATKIAGPVLGTHPMSWVREGKTRFNRYHLETAVHDSLKRLKTDYIDLYQLHWPERNMNRFGQLGYVHQPETDPTPIEETLTVLGDLVKQGKIRAIGLSNESAWGVMTFLQKAKELNLPRVASIQNAYSLLARQYEINLAEVSMRENCGLLAYSPLGFGVLTGKYLKGARPAGARNTLFDRYKRYLTPKAEAATEKYVLLAKKHGLTPVQLALAFVNSREFVTSNLIAATNLDQLKENMSSIDITLNSDILAGIETIHAENTNPCV